MLMKDPTAKFLVDAAFRFVSILLVLIVIIVLSLAFPTDGYAQAVSAPLHEIATNVDVFDLNWSPDGDLITLATSTGVKIFTSDLKEITELHGHRKNTVSVTWHPDGDLLASSGGSGDSNIRIWERERTTNTFRSQKLIQTDYARVPLVRWSPDGAKLAALGIVDDCSCDELLGEIQIWDTRTWVLQATSTDGYFSPALKLDWSRDSTQIAVAGDVFCYDEFNCPYSDDGVYFLDTHSGTIVHGIETSERASEIAALNKTADFSWDGNNKLAFSRLYSLDIADTTTLQVLHMFGHYYPAALAWRPDGEVLAEYQGEINIIEPDRDVILQNFKPAIGTAFLSWSPDGKKLAIATRAGTIQIWDVSHLPNVENIPTLTPRPTVEFTPSPTPRPVHNP